MKYFSCPAGVATCLVVFLVACCTGCAVSSDGQASSSVHVVDHGRLTVCTNTPYEPFEFDENGHIVGFDIDMMNLLAKRLNLTLSVINLPFEDLATGAALNAGKCDFVAAALAITQPRERFMSFSVPYFNTKLCLIVRKRTVVVHSLADVRRQHLTIGTESGTVAEQYIRSLGFDSRSFEEADTQLDALRTGEIDVLLQDCAAVQEWLHKPENAHEYTIAAILPTDQSYGFATRKSVNSRLLALLNQTIVTARRDGEYTKLYEKWIGLRPL